MPRYTEITYTAEQMRDCRRRVSARDERIIALTAERDQLRAALDDCAHRARRIMGSIGYQEDDNAAWIGPDMHAIVDHANRAEMRESTAREGVKP